MATFLLSIILIASVAAALASRRGRTHGVFYWRGVRNLFIALLITWATFTDGTILRVIGLAVAAVVLGLGALQLSMVRKVRESA